MGSARTILPRDLLILSFRKAASRARRLFGQRHAAGHQERGPEDGVEAHDFFADQVQVGGPERCLLAIHRAHVADERVEPDVEDMIAFHRQRDAPFERGAA